MRKIRKQGGVLNKIVKCWCRFTIFRRSTGRAFAPAPWSNRSFSTIRHRTSRSKGCLTRDGMLHMIFKLGFYAETNWRKLRGFDYLAKVLKGVEFKEGIEVKSYDQIAAWFNGSNTRFYNSSFLIPMKTEILAQINRIALGFEPIVGFNRPQKFTINP